MATHCFAWTLIWLLMGFASVLHRSETRTCAGYHLGLTRMRSDAILAVAIFEEDVQACCRGQRNRVVRITSKFELNGVDDEAASE